MRIEEKAGKLVVTDFDEFDAFRIAGKIEKDGIEFYGQLASSVKKGKVKEALEFLLGEEKKHLIFFEDSLQRLRNEKEDSGEEDDLLTTMDYGTFSAYPNATELDAVLDDMSKAMRLGIAIENKSVEFYGFCLNKVSGQSAKNELGRIIEEEKKHKALFEKLLSSVLKGVV